MIRPRRAALSLAVAALLAIPALTASSEAVVPRKAHLEVLSTLDGAGRLRAPQVLTTGSGATVVTWKQTSRDNLQRSVGVARAAQGASTFRTRKASMSIPGGTLTISDGPHLYRNGDTLRMVADGSANGGDLAATLGIYVWTSTDDGRTWSSPKRVYDSFGTSEIAPDGLGGFWAVTGLSDVIVSHVPASMALQSTERTLSDRIGSRLWIELATAGPDHTLLAAFYSSDGHTYLHVGAAVGRAHDKAVFGELNGAADLAGDTKRGMMVAVHYLGYHDTKNNAVYARKISVDGSGNVTLGKPVRLSAKSDDVVPIDVSVARADKRGRFVATWLNQDGVLKLARSTRSGGWKAPVTVVPLERRGFAYATDLGAGGRWLGVSATNSDGSKSKLVAVRAP